MSGEMCSITDCTSLAHARGWCHSHYGKWYRTGDPEYKRTKSPTKPCEVEGCERTQRARGLCGKHDYRQRTHGSTDDPRQPFEDRFWTNVDVGHPLGCWLWTGTIASTGYGITTRDYAQLMAHRAAYELLMGPIPAGLHLDHLCRNTACVNPDHLEPVRCRTNLLRGHGLSAKNARKTHCKRGHPLSGANLYIHKHGRACRTCSALRQSVYRARRQTRGAA